jgi:hypothetical protein
LSKIEKEESADWQRLFSSEVYRHQRLPGTRGEHDCGVSSSAGLERQGKRNKSA